MDGAMASDADPLSKQYEPLTEYPEGQLPTFAIAWRARLPAKQ